MKKRKLKQFFKENWGWFAFVIWVLLVFTTITTFLAEDFSVQLKLSFVAISVLYTIAGLVLIFKAADKDEKQRVENKNKRLQELKTQEKYYIDLVDRHVKETSNRFKNESLNIDIDTNLEYLISFSNKVNWICNAKIVGKPDSFIIASCLMYSLISHPVIKVHNSDNNEYLQAAISFSINMDAVMNCVFEIISEPITYFEDNGIWLEEKHPKVNISIPNGIIKDSDLYQRIFNTIYRDEPDNRTSIMQFANLLHLIYLNCQ